MLESNSETLRKALKADIYLSSSDVSCWSAQVSQSFRGLRGADVFQQSMKRAAKIPMQAFVSDLRYRQQAVWREAAGKSPREVNKKVVIVRALKNVTPIDVTFYHLYFLFSRRYALAYLCFR